MTTRRRDRSRGGPVEPPRGLDVARLKAAVRLGYGRTVTGASGVYLIGPDREQYLDAAGGPDRPLGHGHPALLAAVREAATAGVAASALLADPGTAAVAARLERLAPGGLGPVGVFGSGQAAMAAGLAVARLLTGREALVVEPLPATTLVPRDAGETWRLARRAHDAGLLVLADERGLGVGRLGTLVAAEAVGLAADLVVASGLGGEFGPVAALLATPDVLAALGRAGPPAEALALEVLAAGEARPSPVACAAAAATLDLLADGAHLGRVARLGAEFGKALSALDWEESDAVVEVRGAGLAWAVECGGPTAAEALVRGLALDRILVAAPPPGGRVVRLLPPLVVEGRELDFMASSVAHATEEL